MYNGKSNLIANQRNKFFVKVKHEDTLEMLEKSVYRGYSDDTDFHLNQALKRRITCIRIYYGVQRSTVAKVLGTTYRQYLRYETGSSSVPVHVADTLALFYNLSLDFVCGLVDIPRKLYEGEPRCINGYLLTDCWGQLKESDTQGIEYVDVDETTED